MSTLVRASRKARGSLTCAVPRPKNSRSSCCGPPKSRSPEQSYARAQELTEKAVLTKSEHPQQELTKPMGPLKWRLRPAHGQQLSEKRPGRSCWPRKRIIARQRLRRGRARAAHYRVTESRCAPC